MSTDFKIRQLSSAAIEVLGQLFVNGPIWDGNLVSKSGRSDLVDFGLAQRDNGWNFLTREGVQLAVGWDRTQLRSWADQRWYRKQNC